MKLFAYGIIAVITGQVLYVSGQTSCSNINALCASSECLSLCFDVLGIGLGVCTCQPCASVDVCLQTFLASNPNAALECVVLSCNIGICGAPNILTGASCSAPGCTGIATCNGAGACMCTDSEPVPSPAAGPVNAPSSGGVPSPVTEPGSGSGAPSHGATKPSNGDSCRRLCWLTAWPRNK